MWDQHQPQLVLLPDTAWVRGKHLALLCIWFNLSSTRCLSSPNLQGPWVMWGHPSLARRTCIHPRKLIVLREFLGKDRKCRV